MKLEARALRVARFTTRHAAEDVAQDLVLEQLRLDQQGQGREVYFSKRATYYAQRYAVTGELVTDPRTTFDPPVVDGQDQFRPLAGGHDPLTRLALFTWRGFDLRVADVLEFFGMTRTALYDTLKQRKPGPCAGPQLYVSVAAGHLCGPIVTGDWAQARSTHTKGVLVGSDFRWELSA